VKSGIARAVPVLFTLFFAAADLVGLPAFAREPDASSSIESFPAGREPTYLAFDGANIWVTNGSDGAVTKLRAADGALQGTFFVGSDPQWITFDGANI